jgi:hypothetical protein
MRKEADIDRIIEVVEKELARDFANLKIIEVKVRGDVDFDNEEVLRVDVVFEGEKKDVDASVLSGVVRHVRPKLTEIGEKAFPLFSFISNRDLGPKRLERA